MKIWKAIIVEDEPLARQELHRLLAPYPNIDIIGEAGDANVAKDLILKVNPNLIFLDIDLGMKTGFDLLESLEVNFQTIFVTAYDDHAIRAFEINALDYLLKPVHPERLKIAIERLGHPFNSAENYILRPSDKILVTRNKQPRFITIHNISIIEANGDYTKIFVKDEYSGLVHQTLKVWEERLPSNLFQRIHRTYIVNISMLNLITSTAAGSHEIHFENIQLPVSRRYLHKIKGKFRIDS